MMVIGRVYESISKNTFRFSSKEYYPNSFVETCKNDDGNSNYRTICKITSVSAVNKRIKSPDFVNYVEENETFVNETLYVYTAVEISCVDIDKNSVDYLFYPQIPGQRVFNTTEARVKLAYSLNDDGISIGCLENMKNTHMHLNLEKIFNPHLVVLGRTGSGKTYFISNLIPKINNSSVYVFSPTNEYNDVKSNNKEFKLLEKKDLLIPYNIQNVSYSYGLNMSEERILSYINIEKDIFSNEDLIKLIQKYYAKKTKASKTISQISFYDDEHKSVAEEDIQYPQYALTLMDKLKRKKLTFSKKSKVDLPNCAVFDLSGLSSSEQESIVNSYLFRIYSRQKNTNIEKRKNCYVFFEEAHNYIPSQRVTLCKDIIVRLAREGRKYGINLCFITQRPRYFDQTAFSQTSNKIIFGMSHPEDIKYSLDDSIYCDADTSNSIQSLRTGECIFNGTAYNAPLKVGIDFDN